MPEGYALAFFPFSILNEGYTGVALFMTLSGYLFAKLLDGKRVNYPAFFWNRALRLFPLLFLVLFVIGIRTYLAGGDAALYFLRLPMGFINGGLQNGAWSVVAELHFYLLLPLLLFLGRKLKWSLPVVVLAAIALRTVLHHQRGEVESLAYPTIVGRIDQFVLGLLAFKYRKEIANRHAVFWLVIAAFLLFYWQFDLKAARAVDPSLLGKSAAWIYIPTLEGLAFGFAISYYDNSFRPPNTGISKLIGNAGVYSYSIYLLHFFVVLQMAPFIDQHIMKITNLYEACLWCVPCFLLMLPIGYLSFRYIESPFLKHRRRYVVASEPAPTAAGGGSTV